MLSRLLEEGAVMWRLAEVVHLTLILIPHEGCIAFFFKLMCCSDSSVIVCIFIKEKDCVYLHKWKGLRVLYMCQNYGYSSVVMIVEGCKSLFCRFADMLHAYYSGLNWNTSGFAIHSFACEWDMGGFNFIAIVRSYYACICSVSFILLIQGSTISLVTWIILVHANNMY